MAIISIVVELKDQPGQLLKVIEPISKLGGNILSIIHQRDKRTPLGRIPVEVSLQIDEKKVEELIESIKGHGIIVRSYNEVRLLATTSILLVGHIIHTDLGDTINSIDKTGYAEVVEMHISMPHLNEPSTAMVTISATGKEKLREAINLLREVCNKKNILMIEPLNEEST
ncbi:ACT domain-containing protein [Archaeoglobus veneficus]|uniref:Amino acid-binding ACT domain protein n=1 Tax=Archaeoglobus veneficus (strain DSM 11195 / SNP6) TaxID=693661 RepID=F2KPQ8_ARCVS|nr:ACT domain-containing protein [Archaeoglobus veneficus]AEA47586.1 amino acid-binding ACT domain protein [Archaeoglobus veneficus SNP6]